MEEKEVSIRAKEADNKQLNVELDIAQAEIDEVLHEKNQKLTKILD